MGNVLRPSQAMSHQKRLHWHEELEEEVEEERPLHGDVDPIEHRFGSAV